MFYKKLKKACPAKLQRSGGFTLLELLVVITISTIIMTTLVFQQSQWNDKLTVSTQAYELALMIRQAQIYALGVREDTAGGGDKFNIGYGIYVDENDLVGLGGVMDRYIFFADRNNNKIYDSSPDEKIGDPIIFTRGVVIDRFCGATGVNPCNNDAGPLNQLNITFFRPEPKANIQLLNNGGGNGGTNPPATIYLKSLGGKFSSVKVETNGQISIQ